LFPRPPPELSERQFPAPGLIEERVGVDVSGTGEAALMSLYVMSGDAAP
jgi:hypothetical protein